jgi:hypothetical protein
LREGGRDPIFYRKWISRGCVVTHQDQRPVSPRPAQGRADVDAFIEQARKTPAPRGPDSGRGRLIFALDATMSRQPTWDLAVHLQGRMFTEAEALGGLDVQLVYFRGLHECRASRFVSGGVGLAKVMSQISVQGGNTQLGRVLSHARDEARRARVGALVFIGDALEERIDPLCATAGELALLGVKSFMFHEGDNRQAAQGFREIARITGGAYAAFDTSSPAKLSALLSAAAAYAAGGRPALEARSRGSEAGVAQNLLSQMR